METPGNRRPIPLCQTVPLTMGNLHGLGFIVVLGVTNLGKFTLLWYASVGREGAEPFGEVEPCVVDDEGRLHSWAAGASARLTPSGDALGIAAFHDPIGPGVREIYLSTVTPEEDEAWDNSVLVDPRGVMVPLG